MEKINPTMVIQQRLASSMGLDHYAAIQTHVHAVDVSSNADFQRSFNTFYIVRRNAEWRTLYYRLFEDIKRSGHADFSLILDELYRLTGNVEASFSSKMLATLRPEMPIWDKYVVQNLGLKIPALKDPDRLQKTKDLYTGIVEWYTGFLSTENAKECLAKFDEMLPDYQWLSPVKKIDFYLWSIRE